MRPQLRDGFVPSPTQRLRSEHADVFRDDKARELDGSGLSGGEPCARLSAR